MASPPVPAAAGGAAAPLPPRPSATPAVAIVIVNFNGLHHLQRCLAALRPTLTLPAEVVVVDNGSSDGSVPWLASAAPWVKCVALPSNAGFGEANRIGIAATEAPLIALLNNDTEPLAGWLEALVAPLAAAPTIAASCAQLRLASDPRTLNAHGGGMSRLGFGFDRLLHVPVSAERDDSRWTQCLFPTAAAMLIRRDAWTSVGGFDRAFFMYHEDVDLGWRLWLAGWRVVVCQDAVVLHTRGGSSPTGTGVSFRDRLGARHAVRSMVKNYGPRLAVVKSIRLARTWIGERQFGLLAQVAWWNLTHSVSTLQERRRVQRLRRVSDSFLFSRGLIDEAPMPTPFPVLAHDAGAPAERYVERSTLEPSTTSGIGRLGPGWYARERVGSAWERRTCGTASCILKLPPSATGTLTVRARQENPPHARVTVRTSESAATVACDAAGRVELLTPARADANGMLAIEIISPVAIPHQAQGNWNFRREGCVVDLVEFAADDPLPYASPSRVSVVIPTYNRKEHLELVLGALARQSHAANEVVVVDDGSTDGTWELLQAWQAEAGPGGRRVAVHQENLRPGRARNRGLAEATGDLVVFIGDDTIPDRGFLEAHLARHAALAGPAAVIGFTDWDRERVRVTPFLEFINTQGSQFGYGLIDEHTEVPFNFFYTSNVSVPRTLLGEAPFDPRFDFVGWEDVELGYRLNLAGVPLVYESSARTRHLHPTTVRSFWRRQRGVGATFPVLCAAHPRLLEEGLFSLPRVPARFRVLIPLYATLLPVMSLLDRLGLRLPDKGYRTLVDCAFFSGLRQALHRANGKAS